MLCWMHFLDFFNLWYAHAISTQIGEESQFLLHAVVFKPLSPFLKSIALSKQRFFKINFLIGTNLYLLPNSNWELGFLRNKNQFCVHCKPISNIYIQIKSIVSLCIYQKLQPCLRTHYSIYLQFILVCLLRLPSWDSSRAVPPARMLEELMGYMRVGGIYCVLCERERKGRTMALEDGKQGQGLSGEEERNRWVATGFLDDGGRFERVRYHKHRQRKNQRVC